METMQSAAAAAAVLGHAGAPRSPFRNRDRLRRPMRGCRRVRGA